MQISIESDKFCFSIVQLEIYAGNRHCSKSAVSIESRGRHNENQPTRYAYTITGLRVDIRSRCAEYAEWYRSSKVNLICRYPWVWQHGSTPRYQGRRRGRSRNWLMDRVTGLD